MKMILRLTPGDDAMVQIWINTNPGEQLAGVMHEDSFSDTDFIEKLRSGDYEQLHVSIEEIPE